MSTYPKRIVTSSLGPEALRLMLAEAVAAQNNLLAEVESGAATFEVVFTGQGDDTQAVVNIWHNVSPSDGD